ncbi:MAG: cytochrome-c oxidase, cbb3-type subunit I, partial [Phycisphaeraceae bacterium]
MSSAATVQLGANQPKLESFSYDDAVVRKFLWAMVIWALVAFLVGIILAIQLPFPTIPFTNIPTNFGLEYLTFGRLRPLHTNAAIFAFAGNAIFAGMYYSTQRLCKCRMFSDKLSNLHFWSWQLVIVSAAITLPMGVTQSKEYAELEWPIDLLIAVSWLGLFGINFFMTLMRRRERHMYVALWFYIATIVTVTILHVFNNLVIPAGFFKSYPIYAGVQDAFMQWWYGHNAVAFFLTTPFLGLMYYFLPKQAGRPVFSYRLSIVHFWSLVFIYIWAGPHHLQYTALPDWAASLGMVFSLMLWMPSWGGMINFLLTLRGAWHKVASDPILKFFIVATTFYGMATFEGPMLSIKSVNALSHYTDWTIPHVHSGARGWNGLLAFGMAYFLAPRLFQTKLYSEKLANLHFWLATFGILLYIIPIYVAGITQGLMWRAMTETGQLAYPDFVETVRTIIPMYVLRIFGGLAYMAGAIIGTYNLYRTWQTRPDTYDVPVHQAPALTKEYDGDATRPAPTIDGVTDTAKRMNVWATGWWHRKWERLPMRFTVYVVIAVSIASLFEIIPTFVIRSNVPTIDTVAPYTPLELAGRDIYIAEGCYNCHSQMIRPILAEVQRYGDYSKPGESVYDHPHQWGSRRIGPDLAREGGKQSDLWHYLHFQKPAEMVPGSIMPPYAWLERKEIDFESIPVRVNAIKLLHPQDDHWQKYAFNENKPYPFGDASVEHAEAQALAIAKRIEEQGGPPAEQLADKQVVAVIAYLQRLGTDLTRAPEVEQAEDAEEAPDESNEAEASAPTVS